MAAKAFSIRFLTSGAMRQRENVFSSTLRYFWKHTLQPNRNFMQTARESSITVMRTIRTIPFHRFSLVP